MAEEFTVRGIGGNSTMNRSAYDDYQQLLAGRRAVGRYTLEEAALTLSDATGESAAPMLKKLIQAVCEGVLPVYAPGQKARYMHGGDFASCVRNFYEEAYECDLNKWLVDNEERIDYRFSAPETKAPPVSQSRDEILIGNEQLVDFIPFAEASVILHNRFGATADELAIWLCLDGDILPAWHNIELVNGVPMGCRFQGSDLEEPSTVDDALDNLLGLKLQLSKFHVDKLDIESVVRFVSYETVISLIKSSSKDEAHTERILKKWQSKHDEFMTPKRQIGALNIAAYVPGGFSKKIKHGMVIENKIKEFIAQQCILVSKEPQAAPASEPVTPAAALTLPPAELPVSKPPASGPGWTLRKPKRYQGYRKQLYDVLKAAHAAGLPRPTALDVLDEFKKNKPAGILSVTSDSMDYQDGNGHKKTADLDAIRVAIRRLLQQLVDDSNN